MCGILGGNDGSWNYSQGIESLRHRGPDGSRVMEFENFTLAFSRLSIVDLSSRAMQPMTAEDGQVAIVFNGEIYGYQKLRNELNKQYKFLSSSDTEVVLASYLIYGDSFIDKIDGMFAIAILDLRVQKLKLFRDRAGIKPLYYYQYGSRFAFASELKALRAARVLDGKRVDYTALYDFLFYGYIPEPKTMFKNCYKLSPACCLIYDLKKKSIQSICEYWKLQVNSAASRGKQKARVSEELRHYIIESVQEQLIADVPIGTFLSGGVDSSIVTYEANVLSPNIAAFTMGFEEDRYDETYYAGLLIQKYHLNAFSYRAGRDDIKSIKPCINKWYDEPFADTSAYPSYLVAKLAREYVKVVLTGDGGDELFGGYMRYNLNYENLDNLYIDSYNLNRLFDKHSMDILDISSPSSLWHKYFGSGLSDYSRSMFHIRDWDDVSVYKKKWGIDDDYDPTWFLRKFYHKDFPPLTRMRYLDFKTYLPGDILTKVDRVSMANSLECRVPLLSRKIIEFAFSLAEEECCQAEALKKILKEAYVGLLPDEILYRTKRGFSAPASYLINSSRIADTAAILRLHWGRVS